MVNNLAMSLRNYSQKFIILPHSLNIVWKEKTCNRLFPVASQWASKDDLKQVITNYRLAFGIKVCQKGWSFACNKGGYTKDRLHRNPDVPDDKRRKGNRSMKVGCNMNVKYTYNEKKQRGLAAGMVRVTSCDFTHTNDCVPSGNQLIICRTASGDYSKMSQTLVTTVMALLENDPGTSTRVLRAMLRVGMPSYKG